VDEILHEERFVHVAEETFLKHRFGDMIIATGQQDGADIGVLTLQAFKDEIPVISGIT